METVRRPPLPRPVRSSRRRAAPARQCCCRWQFATRSISRELEIASPIAGCGVPETSTTPHHPDGQLDEDALRHVCAVEAAPAAGNPQSSAQTGPKHQCRGRSELRRAGSRPQETVSRSAWPGPVESSRRHAEPAETVLLPVAFAAHSMLQVVGLEAASPMAGLQCRRRAPRCTVRLDG